MILKILIDDENPPHTIAKPRKIISMGFEYPDYDSARKDFDVLCDVFGRIIDYRREIDEILQSSNHSEKEVDG